MLIHSLNLPPTLSLAGKSAIVTGSSRGIGRGLALLLAQRGAVVAITYTSDSSTALAESLAAEINALTRACIIKADLASADCGPEIIQGALRGLGVAKIDILVNNAAVGPPPLPATDFDGEAYDKTMNINVRAPILLVKELLPVLSRNDGRIINISSVITKFPVPTRTVYAISKAALESLTQQWAIELPKQYNCTVNAVRVGATVTEASAASAQAGDDPAREKARAKVIEQTSAGARLGEIDDIAQVVAWLASEGSRWVNGQTLNANGGVVFT